MSAFVDIGGILVNPPMIVFAVLLVSFLLAMGHKKKFD